MTHEGRVPDDPQPELPSLSAYGTYITVPSGTFAKSEGNYPAYEGTKMECGQTLDTMSLSHADQMMTREFDRGQAWGICIVLAVWLVCNGFTRVYKHMDQAREEGG